MSVRSGQSIGTTFTTSRFDTGNSTNADSLPTGILYVNGVTDVATVTITNITTGLYKAAVTLPTLAVGDWVCLVITAIVNSVTGRGKVWEDSKDVLLDASGQVTTGAIATDAITSGAVAASAVTEIQTGLATSAALALVQADTDDIQARLPAALVTGRMDCSVGAMATDVITSGALATTAVTEIQTGLSTLDAAGVRTAVGLASANLDTQLSGIQADTNDLQTRIPAALVAGRMDASVGAMATDVLTAAALATSAVTEIQTGLATSAALATVQADTDDIQTRLPAALVTGRMDCSVGAMAANTMNASALATDAVTELVNGVWNELQSGHTTAGTFGRYLDSQVATVQADTDNIQTRLPTTLVSGRMDCSVGAMATDVITSGALATTAVTEIQTGLSTLDAAGVRTAVGLASANLDTQLSGIQADTDNLQTRVPAALVAGRMDCSVGAMAANVLTAAAMAADAGGEIADAVWDEALSGHLSAGSTGYALNAAGAAGDPWSTSLPGAYAAGSAGYIVGHNLDVPVSTVGGGSLTVAAIADGVWDELASAHSTYPGAASFGQLMAYLYDFGAVLDSSGVNALVAAYESGTWNVAVRACYDVFGVVAGQVTGTGVTMVGPGVWGLTGTGAAIAPASATTSIQFDVDDMQTRLPAALVGGRMDSSVGAMANNTLTAAALAADAVTEIHVGLSTLDAAGVRAAVGLAAANMDLQFDATYDLVVQVNGKVTVIDDLIDTEVAAIKAKTDQLTFTAAGKVDAKLTSDGLDLIDTTAPTGPATTFPQMQIQTWRRFFKRSTCTASQLRTYRDDGATVATTQVVSDDGTTQTQGPAS